MDLYFVVHQCVEHETQKVCELQKQMQSLYWLFTHMEAPVVEEITGHTEDWD